LALATHDVVGCPERRWKIMNRLLRPEAEKQTANTPMTVAELMTQKPSSLLDAATVWDAICFLTSKGFSAAPVVDGAGHPVGVLSRADIITHNRDTARRLRASQADAPLVPCVADPTPVRHVMTPFVILVAPETAAEEAARQMVTSKIHRLFVVDNEGILIGVLSALDLLRYFGQAPKADALDMTSSLDEE
jgi:CBS domain-containing protein